MNYNEITQITSCPITKCDDRFTYIDLGDMPLVNNLCNSKEESLSCKRYPLKVQLFEESKLSTLTDVVSSELLFSNYLFKSDVNKPYITHCKRMFDYISGLIKLNENDLIIDIGGNDGTLLSAFKNVATVNLKYLNVDPSNNLAELSRSKGIPVFTNYFSYETSELIKDSFNRKRLASVIVSTNVFQHLENINSFIDGVYNLLEDEGIWVLEFPYWSHDLETNQFDQIYHEHVYYYSVTALSKLMSIHNLKIIRIDKQKIHGGTLRMIMTKNSSKYVSDFSILNFMDYEKKFDIEYYKNWGKQIESHTIECRKLINQLKSDGKRIAAFGAAAKGCIFLNKLGINYNHIEFIIDDTDIKQGKYMPGTGLKIVSREVVKDEKLDYIIILTHNFTDYIIDSLKNIYKGNFIIFLPQIKII